MSSPMPMVTLTKTFDVSNLIKVSRKAGVKFNALLCWCIGKAATQTEEFYILPENGKLFQYDCIAVNVIVNNREGGINSCDIPFTDDLKAFLHEYDTLTEKVAAECKSTFLEDYICDDSDRTGQHSQPIHRHVLQSYGYVGQIPKALVQDNSSDLIPVPSHPDRRCPSR